MDFSFYYHCPGCQDQQVHGRGDLLVICPRCKSQLVRIA
jgi:ribosomal protein S27E